MKAEPRRTQPENTVYSEYRAREVQGGCPSRDKSLLTGKQRQAAQELTERSKISPAMELMVPKPA